MSETSSIGSVQSPGRRIHVRLGEASMDDPVTGHMGYDFVQFKRDRTVGEALASIRQYPPAGRIIYFYVADDEGRVCGVVPTRRLLLSPLDAPLEEIMVKSVIAVPATATVLEACEMFTLHRLLAFPVVDQQQRIVGIVDIDLYTEGLDEIEEAQRSEDLFQLIGVHLTEAQQASPFAAFRSRFPWLLCNIAGGVMAAFLSGLFEEELQRVVALALFVPVVLALAESVSIQSVSLTLLMLRGQPPTARACWKKLQREFGTGALLGLAGAALVAIVALVWQQNWRVAACLFAGITGGVTMAAVIGVAMPNVLRMFRRNPQVASGPVVLAASDMVTLWVYFSLARAIT